MREGDWKDSLTYEGPRLRGTAYPGAGTITLEQGDNVINIPRDEWAVLVRLAERSVYKYGTGEGR